MIKNIEKSEALDSLIFKLCNLLMSLIRSYHDLYDRRKDDYDPVIKIACDSEIRMICCIYNYLEDLDKYISDIDTSKLYKEVMNMIKPIYEDYMSDVLKYMDRQ